MKKNMVKWSLCLVCGLTILAAMPTRSNAGLIPWLYNAIFGPVGSHGFHGGAAYYPPINAGPPVSGGCCSPTGPALGAPAQAYYAPVSYQADYNSYGSRTFAGYAGGNCGGRTFAGYDGNCGGRTSAGYAQGSCSGFSGYSGSCGATAPPSDQPIPDNSIRGEDVPRTYADEPDNADTGAPSAPDEGFRPREDGEDGGAPAEDLDETDAFRYPNTTIPERQPAPTPNPADESNNPAGCSSSDSKAEPANAPESLKVPTLDLDEKITCRSNPSKKRMAIQSNFSSPLIARKKIELNQNWVPVPEEEAAVASK